MRNGFVLLELMITLLISSFLLVSFNGILYQSERAKNFVERKTNSAMRLSAVTNQLERDLLGIISPLQKPKEKEEVTGPKQKKQELQPPVKITRDSDGTVTECRFLTINPFPQFKPATRIREIIYSTEKGATRASLKLRRTEQEVSEEKKQSDKTTAPGIIIADSISKFNVQFVSVTAATDKGEQQIKLLNEWPQEKVDVEKKQEAQPTISHIILEYTDASIGDVRIITPLFLKKQQEQAQSSKNGKDKQEEQGQTKNGKTVSKNLKFP